MDTKNIISAADTAIKHSYGVFSYIMEPKRNANSYLLKEIESLEGFSVAEKYLLKRHVRKLEKQFRNTASIIEKAARQIGQEPERVSANDNHQINEDWLDYFIETSQNSSADLVQEMWAQLLVAEHLEENSVPKRLIHILSIMDSDSALAFTDLCSRTVTYHMNGPVSPTNSDQTFPLILDQKTIELIHIYEEISEERAIEGVDILHNISEKHLSELEVLGLIKRKSERKTSFYMGTYPIEIRYFDSVYKPDGIKCRTRKGERYRVSKGQGAEYTAAGKALFDILTIEPNPKMYMQIERLVECYKNNPQLVKNVLSFFD